MLFEKSRWTCPKCHKYTFTKPGEVEAVCGHCGFYMSAASVLLAISVRVQGAMTEGALFHKQREGHA